MQLPTQFLSIKLFCVKGGVGDVLRKISIKNDPGTQNKQ